MRIINKILLLAGVMGVLASCEPEDPIESTITYYPEVQLQGEELMLVEQNTSFEDPEIIATIQGEEVPYEINGSVDTATPGSYTIQYAAYNDDGFAATVNRTVYVYENNGTVAGFWYGSSPSSSENPVLITSTDDPEVFEVTDVLAGHYEYGAGYGAAYAVPSTITVSGGTVSSPGGANAFGYWTVDHPTITEDRDVMSWGATLVDQGFSLSGLMLEKVTP